MRDSNAITDYRKKVACLSREVSTLEYRSNLQPVNRKVSVDKEFMSHIHDPFALDMMSGLIDKGIIQYKMSGIQSAEMKNASRHCSYAFSGDYPWGTVNTDGEQKVVCKCINLECTYFNSCRKGTSAFDESELDELKIRESEHAGISKYIETGLEFKKSLIKNEIEVPEEAVEIKPEIKSEKITVKKPEIKEIKAEISDFNEKPVFKGKEFEKFRDTDQDYVISASESERMIINAGPGTGKTWALIEKLIYMTDILDVDPEEILVLCFSRAAVEVIQNRLKEAFEQGRIGMNWHLIDIRTFDSFATHLLAYVSINDPCLLRSNFRLDKLDYDERIRTATEVLIKDKKLIEQCSHLIVDEVQDLVSVRAKFVMQIIASLPGTSGYTLLGDACQSIYDYQILNNDIDSSGFYKWIFEKNSKSEFWKFSVNHRQKSQLEKTGNIYREAILSGDQRKCSHTLSETAEKIDELRGFNFHDISVKDINDLKKEGTLGILTRTNGQALKISTLLRNNGIPHVVQRSSSDYSLNRWIADIFCGYENDTIDRYTFIDLVEETGINESAEDIWSEVEKTQYESKNRYYVKDILRGIANNSKSDIMFAGSKDTDVIISNIHRSKGREYDNVILLNEMLQQGDDYEKDIQEHKVAYVGFTRARENIYRVENKKEYFNSYRNGISRAYKKSPGIRGKKPGLALLEIGKRQDIDPASFAHSVEAQDAISNNDIIGERVILKKNKENSYYHGYVCYDVLLEDFSGHRLLGITSSRFYEDLTGILKEIHGLNNCNVFEHIYPTVFSDLYVEDIISVISPYNEKATAGRAYSDVMIWKGVSLTGIARVERDKY